jgi:hypothetical protein
MSTTDDQYVDVNAAAGELSRVFAFDVTTATGECAGCGRTAVFAEARVYLRAPGMVVRCPGCDGVLMRMVEGPGRAWLDMRGLAHLQLVMAAE